MNQFLSYPENSAGSVHDHRVCGSEKRNDGSGGPGHIRKTGVDKETINTCYVLAENRKLEGIVSIRKLILSDADVKLHEIMETNIIYAHTLEDQEDVADRSENTTFSPCLLWTTRIGWLASSPSTMCLTLSRRRTQKTSSGWQVSSRLKRSI